jgi:hypothetical protein
MNLRRKVVLRDVFICWIDGLENYDIPRFKQK